MLGKGVRISPKSVASWFLNNIDRDSGEAITHLKLQKLLYYTEAWYLANFDRPLFEENFRAWAHGPVCRSDKYKAKGWDALPSECRFTKVPQDIEEFLKAVNSEYGQFSAKKLENFHNEDPWQLTRGNLPHEALTSQWTN